MERALGKEESPGFVVGTTEYAPFSWSQALRLHYGGI